MEIHVIMLKHFQLGRWTPALRWSPPRPNYNFLQTQPPTPPPLSKPHIANVNVLRPRVLSTRFAARRRALRYDDDDGGEDDEGVEYGHNKEIAVLGLYSQCERRSTYCACNG
ncbi:hypothetical protein C1H46_043537 [Malus baccata]|uniref:Uncharacterized protein n=1 Tax=Malus baccata TaxID=106549 RepID=A0A540K9L6_MALBA|nr:hypothetical protein C1H46_043537 [Malus baccata]